MLTGAADNPNAKIVAVEAVVAWRPN
jgi:hypothetical protein